MHRRYNADLGDGPLQVFVGSDPREPLSFAVTIRSMLKHASAPLQVSPLGMESLQAAGLYTRPTEMREGGIFDVISNLYTSTAFNLARFWVPYLTGYEGWALFVDGDWLFRDDVAKLFALADPRHAVMVVKHNHVRAEELKMDGRAQKAYPCKLWSALMLFNCSHRTCARLEPHLLNNAHRNYLHQFAWCRDKDVGELPQNWHVVDIEPAGYHLTLGTPELGVWGSEHDDEWLSYLSHEELTRLMKTPNVLGSTRE